MTKNRVALRGFTLIELVVTIALVAILMAVAVPSMREFQRNAQLTSFANNMLATINAAKSEAMKRGVSVVVVPLNGSDWKTGMVVFIDKSSPLNLTYESATDLLILQNAITAPDYLTLTPNNSPGATPPYIRFDAQGYPNPTAGLRNFTISITRNDVAGSAVFQQTRLLKLAITGRARICTPTSSSDATCSVTSTS